MLNTQQPDIGCRNNPALMGYMSPMMTNNVGMFSSPHGERVLRHFSDGEVQRPLDLKSVI